ncbi:MAG: ABC transporter ATP-binding protein [Candidatus Sumerlaeaceae bacterium]|nr:ABC transporter ATP-binding protein [Candidatus Sumerlaeaceae bacterium]
MEQQHEWAVEMLEITRAFARVVANDRITFRVRRGEIHALVGENGAGKSTLMKILYGLYRPDSGEIRIFGRHVRFRSPADAIATGIGMVHQHFMLVPPFTVAENVTLGDERVHFGIYRPHEAQARVATLIEQYAMALDPRARVADLSVGEQQRVEILKILYRDARLIILDEPTAVLTPQEVETLFSTIRRLHESGKTIIIITHKLHEVMALSERLTVLRAGKWIATLDTNATTPEEIARLMVGRDVILPTLARDIEKLRQLPVATPAQQNSKPAGEECSRAVTGSNSAPCVPLRVEGVELRRAGRQRPVLSNISFSVSPGEIVGVAGVEGNGQKELIEVLTGLAFPTSGRIFINGHDVTTASPRVKFSAGMACVPEDRQRHGLILDFNLRENLLLGRHHDWRNARHFTWERARRLLEDFDVRPPDPRMRAAQLSGGNQQKLVAAREFTRGATLLVAAHPTRGIDLGAIEFLHGKLLELRARGVGILLISSELGEILALSDRVLVMYGGKIVFEAPNCGLSERDLGIYMAGGTVAQVVDGGGSQS